MALDKHTGFDVNRIAFHHWHKFLIHTVKALEEWSLRFDPAHSGS